jgi:hypothetical protein
MMIAQWNLIYAKQGVGWAIGPIINSAVFWYIGSLFACNDITGASEMAMCRGQASFWLPYMIIMVLPRGVEIGMRFTITQLVEDKEKKVRDTLKIMGLSQLGYSLSFLLLQGFLAIICAAIMVTGIAWDDTYFPQDKEVKAVKAFIALILLFTANITFSMSISTLFTSAKVASDLAPISVMIPVVLLLLILQKDFPAKGLVYPLCVFPPVPPVLLLIRFVSV